MYIEDPVLTCHFIADRGYQMYHKEPYDSSWSELASVMLSCRTKKGRDSKLLLREDLAKVFIAKWTMFGFIWWWIFVQVHRRKDMYLLNRQRTHLQSYRSVYGYMHHQHGHRIRGRCSGRTYRLGRQTIREMHSTSCVSCRSRKVTGIWYKFNTFWMCHKMRGR